MIRPTSTIHYGTALDNKDVCQSTNFRFLFIYVFNTSSVVCFRKMLFKYMTYFGKKLTYFAIFCKISQTFSYLFYSEYIWNFWSLHLTISYKHSILKWEILALQMPRVLVNSAVTLFNWIVPLLFSLLKYKNFKVTYFGK